MTRRCLVSVHAHPDDEALLLGGTLAGAAAAGHRVVLVVATDGAAGLSDEGPGPALAARRRAEVARSARALGVARVVHLDHPDSGSGPAPDPSAPDPSATGGARRFCDLDPDEVARPLAALLVEEAADVVTGYDPAGGYGHPDHRQVHEVVSRAAVLAGTPVLLEATLPRRGVQRALAVLRALARVVALPRLPATTAIGTAEQDLTHRVDVRAHLDAKLDALRAHASQAAGGPRTVSALLALPAPLRARVLGHEHLRVRRPACEGPAREVAARDLLDVLLDPRGPGVPLSVGAAGRRRRPSG